MLTPIALESLGAGRPRILYQIYTTPKNYRSKLRISADSWLRDIPPSDLLITSVNSTIPLPPPLEPSSLLLTECPDTYRGICCKDASGFVAALDRQFDWLFLVGDDHFVVPRLLSEALSGRDPAIAWGYIGCGADTGASVCRHDVPRRPHVYYGAQGLCGGAGIALSRQTIQRMVDGYGGPAGFMSGYLKSCAEPEPFSYSDGVLSCELRHFGVRMRHLGGRLWPNRWRPGLSSPAELEKVTAGGWANLHRINESEAHALRDAFAAFESAAAKRSRGVEGAARVQALRAQSTREALDYETQWLRAAVRATAHASHGRARGRAGRNREPTELEQLLYDVAVERPRS